MVSRRKPENAEGGPGRRHKTAKGYPGTVGFVIVNDRNLLILRAAAIDS